MMKKAFTLLFLFIFSTSLFAAPFKQLIFLGDSLTDDGNLYRLLGGYYPDFPPYFNGRFSNGITWAEDLGKYYYDTANASFKNYAYGGATANDNPSMPELTLQAEIDNFLNDAGNTIADSDLFVLWFGANDYLNDNTTDVDVLSSSVMDALAKNIARLVGQGAKQFLLFDLPNLADTPYSKSQPEKGKRLGVLAELHNKKIAVLVETLKKQYPAVDFKFISIGTFWNKFLQDPEAVNKKYGTHVSNTDQACLPPATNNRLPSELVKPQLDKKISITTQKILLNSPDIGIPAATATAYQNNETDHCAKPDDYVFWDLVHPTQVVHKVVAQFIIEELDKIK